MEGDEFKCHKCGKECPIAPANGGKAVCEDCCEDHRYEYDPGERGHFCIWCFKKRPDDWFDE